ncbi:MAG: prolipoprotein diacylglyceryl transferase [Bifidobacteriaceae bacterium]|jgi:prolipoprotein diacylglyceryl transferase|nr:prolipoprotein diacylglyceryl transferase [Bifidobacteriaceae bacterium]
MTYINLASIPSPSSSEFDFFGVPVHIYGICIAVAFIIASVFCAKRYQYFTKKSTMDTSIDILDYLVIIMPTSIVGARLYYVATVPELYFGEKGNWVNIFKIWEGGLGILGGIAGALIGIAIVNKYLQFEAQKNNKQFYISTRQNIANKTEVQNTNIPDFAKNAGDPTLAVTLALFLDIAAPALPLGQAIGRIGNYFNQELYGTPTDLPWGLEIKGETYHPSFLYEMIYCIVICIILQKVGGKQLSVRTKNLTVGLEAAKNVALPIENPSFIQKVKENFQVGTGNLCLLYFLLYTPCRGLNELLRTDYSNYIFGLRVNSVILFIIFFVTAFILYIRITSDDEIRFDPTALVEDAPAPLGTPAVMREPEVIETATVVLSSNSAVVPVDTGVLVASPVATATTVIPVEPAATVAPVVSAEPVIPVEPVATVIPEEVEIQAAPVEPLPVQPVPVAVTPAPVETIAATPEPAPVAPQMTPAQAAALAAIRETQTIPVVVAPEPVAIPPEPTQPAIIEPVPVAAPPEPTQPAIPPTF